MTRNVLLMHMNEASGTIVDTSGNGNNGTYNGALYSQTGKLNTAIGFDGGDDYVQMDDTNPLFDSTKPLTVALWVRSDGSAQVPSPTIWILKTDQSTGFLMFLNYQGGDYAGINFGSNANFLRYRTAGDISGDFINTWKYVVLTYDGVNRASVSSYKVYVDGVEQGLTEAGLFGEEPNSNRIGVDVLGSDWYFDGLIDEVAIWNRSLSADEILDIYKRGALRLNLQTKTSDDGSSWTSWSSNHTNPSNLINSSARYLQYKATLTTDNTSITPYLQWVNLSYFLLQCSPNLNENWIITDAQVCDAKEVTTGTGKITVSTGGNLSLINSANVTANGFEITRTGNCVFINKECELKIM
ncbi:LamG domain-containing protein [Candidatus Pacearchaeota archaeon]|nr:LamG domain-containing protein [Candidatus Pacearchaeota archaeon]